MARSRLEKRLVRKTKVNLFLSVVGIIAVFFLLVKFGVPLIADFGLFLSGFKDSEGSSKEKTFLSPPMLNTLPSATNSAEIVISGKGAKDTNVEIFLNDELLEKTSIDDKGNFSIDAFLSEGDNTIKARVEKDEKKSSYSDSLSVSFKKSAPKITLNFPGDGQKFEKEQNKVNVSGNTDATGSVTVNGFWAVIDEKNDFSYTLPLKEGDNEIKIVATDQAGNKTEKSIKVTYSP